MRYSFICLLIMWTFLAGNTQKKDNSDILYFISDCQEPLRGEKLFLNAYRNIEARDSLFSDIIRQHPSNLFLLGDMVAIGSSKYRWKPIDEFISILHQKGVHTYAIPGNHEYYTIEREGIKNFQRLFPESRLYGYKVIIDSVAVLMLNSNSSKIPADSCRTQLDWFTKTMNELDHDSGIKLIMVCTHHPPYTNSRVVEPSKFVKDSIVPLFELSLKTKLFISGHSHNLEYFKSNNKNYMVIGGGGGLTQPLLPIDKSIIPDVLNQEQKPLYFYIVISRNGNTLKIEARGLKRDFSSIKYYEIGNIQ